MRVMSFNLRSDFILDFKNRWDNRRELVYDIIKKYQCDIMEVQEVRGFFLKEIIYLYPKNMI